MRAIRVLTSSVRGVVLSDAAALFSGTQIDKRSVIDPTDTVLDPKISKEGGWIDLPHPGPWFDYAVRQISTVYYPAFENQEEGRVITMCQMAVAGNRLLRVIASFNEGTTSSEVVQKAIISYQYQAIKQLGGKHGVLNSSVVASRVRDSGRAVVIVNGSRDPESVGLPQTIMARLGIEEEDYVIVGREPTIWGGSIEVLCAREGRSDCIELHPLIFKQLGADCDGDTAWIYKVPKNGECQKEASEQVLGFTRGFAKWPAYLRLTEPSDEVNWETVTEDCKRRARVTGFSISPEDIMCQSESLQHLCKTTGKDVAAECKEIATGLTLEAYKTEVERQNIALLHMKMGMGPIGAAANRLRLFAGTDKDLLISASYVSERLQQMLLDTKHWIGRKDVYSPDDVLNMLNRKGPFEHAHLEDIIAALQKIGMDSTQSRPIISYLWIHYPLIRAVQELFPEITPSRMQRVRGYIKEIDDPESVNRVLRKVIVASGGTKGVTREKLIETYARYALGLNKICEAEFPLAVLMSDRTIADRIKAMAVAHAVFGKKIPDAGGVTRLAMETVNA